ncbi:hypothetical protein SAMN04487988_10748 [Algoriphagus hitonicola]|uniref:Uncharacterized protein n=1 Tax=Algoriphagus hitonicola TaxID=435880 RepID=A0A1I2U515_9BACT|nr:hypothetical protein [Algoriphagus hitonicola]SFG72168.1 hypothetical protein SAMN04487988_10748 [Algoriphagus hitonicola]
MKKLSLIFAFGFLGSLATVSGQSCDIRPETGKTYVAGFCFELTNTCFELGPPEPGEQPLIGDCFVAKAEETDPGIG